VPDEHEKALLMAMVVRPCVTNGEKIFEESEAVDWQKEMCEWTWAHKQERMEMAHEARIVETDDATCKGRVYVVACTPRLVKSAHQARQVGKDILRWLGKECVIFRLLTLTLTLRSQGRDITVMRTQSAAYVAAHAHAQSRSDTELFGNATEY
jgi:hypothetical protein